MDWPSKSMWSRIRWLGVGLTFWWRRHKRKGGQPSPSDQSAGRKRRSSSVLGSSHERASPVKRANGESSRCGLRSDDALLFIWTRTRNMAAGTAVRLFGLREPQGGSRLRPAGNVPVDLVLQRRGTRF